MAERADRPGKRPRKAVMTWIDVSVCDQVDELAAEKDVSRAWVMRRALAEYIDRQAGVS